MTNKEFDKAVYSTIFGRLEDWDNQDNIQDVFFKSEHGYIVMLKDDQFCFEDIWFMTDYGVWPMYIITEGLLNKPNRTAVVVELEEEDG